ESSLVNCTVISNICSGSLTTGGGTYEGDASGCIIYYNQASLSSFNYSGTVIQFSCTTPAPPVGAINFTEPPRFINLAMGDLHLASDSPCINSGYNGGFDSNSTDFDGNPRIVGGTVDAGAYEFPAPIARISYAWLTHYGLPTDGSADFSDADG